MTFFKNKISYIQCPNCLGYGYFETEIAVIDYIHGGYLQEVLEICERCQGDGEVSRSTLDDDEFDLLDEE